MSTAFVRAVVVTDGRSEHLPAVLAALAALDEPPAILHLVLLGEADVVLPDGLEVEPLPSSSTTYAEGIAEVLDRYPERDGELLWLLHDDTAPAPDALTRLVATASKRPRAAIVGAAHVRWKDQSRLVNLGTTVSRFGARRVGLVVEDDINQGQHDWREDVLAVSLAAALVRRDAWEALGGIDAGYRGFGDSLEFCRRAWASGHDVVVEPSAVVRHAQESLYGLRSARAGRAATHARRRVSEWHHALAWSPWWLLPVLAVLVPLSAIVRFPVRLAQNTPRIAFAELAVPVLLAARLPAIVKTAAAHRSVGATGRIEARLLATPRQVVDAVRHRELGGFDRSRAAKAPSDIVRVEIEKAKARHRLGLLVTVVAGVGAAAAVGVPWVRALAAGQMITGPGLGSTSVSFDTVWTRAWTGWSEQGLGSPGIDGAFAGLMAPLALLPGGLRVGLGVLLVAAPFVATLLAWAAAGLATRGPWMRVAIALVFGLWPPFLEAVFDARVGAVIAHLALVVAAMALARAMGWRRGELVGDREQAEVPPASASAGLAASLALTVATVAQPVLLLPVLAVVAVLGTLARATRWRMWGSAAVPLVVGLPGLLAAARHAGSPTAALAILAREPGPGADFDGAAWRVALGLADSDRWSSTLHAAGPLGALAAIVCLGAALAAVASRVAVRPALVGVSLAALGLGVAAWSSSTVVAWPDLAGSGSVSGWPGAGSSLVVLGALIAGASAHGALLSDLRKRAAVGRVIGAALGMAAAGASVAVVTFLAWPGAARGTATTADAHVLPLAVPLDQEGPSRQRVLVLTQTEDGAVAYAVLSHDGTTTATGRADRGEDGTSSGAPDATVVGTDAIARAVAEATTSGAADVSALSDWGIGLIVVTPGGDRIRSALDQNPAISMVGGSERGVAYRVAGGTSARAWIEADGTRENLASSATSGSTRSVPADGGTLVIAVPASAGWRAWANGSELASVADDKGRAAFAVPAGSTRVTYAYRDPAQRWWWWTGAIAVSWALLGAVPLRRAREEAP